MPEYFIAHAQCIRPKAPIRCPITGQIIFQVFDLRNIRARYDSTITIILMARVPMLALYRCSITLWHLMELKLELLIQCFPAFILALHWRQLSSASVIAGLLMGLTILAMMLAMGVKQLYGINAGLIALVGNVTLMICVSFSQKLALSEPGKESDQAAAQ